MNTYTITITDTFGGEANFSWVQKHAIRARSFRGAILALGKRHGGHWRCTYDLGDEVRYDMLGACICAFVTAAD